MNYYGRLRDNLLHFGVRTGLTALVYPGFSLLYIYRVIVPAEAGTAVKLLVKELAGLIRGFRGINPLFP